LEIVCVDRLYCCESRRAIVIVSERYLLVVRIDGGMRTLQRYSHRLITVARCLCRSNTSGRVSRTGPGSCVIVSKESPRDPLIITINLEVLWSPSRREPACRKALGICELCSCSVPAVVWFLDRTLEKS
jgi:hypothetical protein